jgi:hypothetical protein
MADTLLYDNEAVSTATNEVTLAEDVSNIVINLFPKDKPLQMLLGRDNMTQPMKEQPIRRTSNITRDSTMFAADTNFVKPEFNPAALGATFYHAKLKGIAEIHQEAFGVSGTFQASSFHGVGDPYADHMMETMDKVGNDNELAFWWSPGTTVFGADLSTTETRDVKRQTQGLMHWILKSGLERTKIGLATGITDGNGNVFAASGGGALDMKSASYAIDLAGVNLDRSSFRDLMEKWYGLAGNLQDRCFILCSGGVKGLFTTFANTAQGAINERKIEAASKLIIDSVDAYETDYGMHFVHISRYLTPSPDFTTGRSSTIAQSTGTTTVQWEAVLAAIQPRFYKIGTMRPISYYPLPRDADGDKGQITSELGLLCLNPQGGVAAVNCLAA